jgi:hypothetical protein
VGRAALETKTESPPVLGRALGRAFLENVFFITSSFGPPSTGFLPLPLSC